MNAAQAADSLKMSCTGDMIEPGGVYKIAYYVDGSLQSRKQSDKSVGRFG